MKRIPKIFQVMTTASIAVENVVLPPPEKEKRCPLAIFLSRPHRSIHMATYMRFSLFKMPSISSFTVIPFLLILGSLDIFGDTAFVLPV